MGHHHHHDGASSLTFHQKFEKILQHWIKHNQEHADNYIKWANDAGQHLGERFSAILNDAAELTKAMNKKFDEALKLLEKIEK